MSRRVYTTQTTGKGVKLSKLLGWSIIAFGFLGYLGVETNSASEQITAGIIGIGLVIVGFAEFTGWWRYR